MAERLSQARARDTLSMLYVRLCVLCSGGCTGGIVKPAARAAGGTMKRGGGQVQPGATAACAGAGADAGAD